MIDHESLLAKPSLFLNSMFKYSLYRENGVFLYKKNMKSILQLFWQCIIGNRKLLVIVDERGVYSKRLRILKQLFPSAFLVLKCKSTD